MISFTVVKTLIYISYTNVCNMPTVCLERCHVQFLNSTPYGVRFFIGSWRRKASSFEQLTFSLDTPATAKILVPPVTATPFSFARINVYVDHCDHTSSSVPRLRMRGDMPPLPYTFLLWGAYVSIGTTLLKTMVVLYGRTNEAVAREPKAIEEIILSCVLHCVRSFFGGANNFVVLRRMCEWMMNE